MWMHKPPLKTQVLHYTKQRAPVTLWGVRHSKGVAHLPCLEFWARHSIVPAEHFYTMPHILQLFCNPLFDIVSLVSLNYLPHLLLTGELKGLLQYAVLLSCPATTTRQLVARLNKQNASLEFQQQKPTWLHKITFLNENVNSLKGY